VSVSLFIKRAVDWTISAPSRLHFGLFDLNGAWGRIDGGAGVALTSPRVVVRARSGPGGLRVPQEMHPLVAGLADALAIDLERVELELVERFPSHVGLGSHTQLALALGTALCLAAGRDEPPRAIARAAKRGGTSGIGVNIFNRGGLVVDGGHSFGPGREKEECLPSSASRADVPPLLARYQLPDQWRFVLVTPRTSPGAHGKQEVNLFKQYFPLPSAETGEVCRRVLMGLMPGAAGRDLTLLGQSLSALQQVGFKKLEVELQPPAVVELLQVMTAAGAAGAGLTSFGPTCYGLAGDEQTATRVVAAALEHLQRHGLAADTWVTSVDNAGVTIRHEGQEEK